MSEPIPDSQECKRRAVAALVSIATLDPGDEDSVDVAKGAIAIAQVWATLATVPDVERVEIRRDPPADTGWLGGEPKPPNGPGMAGWFGDERSYSPQARARDRFRSRGGAGQWNG